MSDRSEWPDTGNETGAAAGREITYTTPRWVKAFGLATVVVVVLVVVLHLGGVGGTPGPGLHAVPAEHGVQRP